MKDFFKQHSKWIYSTALAVLILGPITNTLGTYIFQKIWAGIVWLVLTLSTLGITQLQNNIYLEIAKGFHEDASLLILCAVLGAFSGALVSVPMLKLKRTSESDWSSFMDKKGFVIPFVAITFILLSFLLIEETYKNDAITYYQQLLHIAQPNLSSAQVDLLNSQFAQIQSKSDYVTITKGLEVFIAGKGLKAPRKIFYLI